MALHQYLGLANELVRHQQRDDPETEVAASGGSANEPMSLKMELAMAREGKQHFDMSIILFISKNSKEINSNSTAALIQTTPSSFQFSSSSLGLLKAACFDIKTINILSNIII